MDLKRQQKAKGTKSSRRIIKLCDENKDNVRPISSRRRKHHENFNAGDDCSHLQPIVKLYDINSVPVLKTHCDKRRALSDRNNISASSKDHLNPIVKLHRIDHACMLKSSCYESITFHHETSLITMPFTKKQANAVDGQSTKDYKVPEIESKMVDSPNMHLRSADRHSSGVSLESKEIPSNTPSRDKKNVKIPSNTPSRDKKNVKLDTACRAKAVVHELRNRKCASSNEQDIFISSVTKETSGQCPTLRKISIGSKIPFTSSEISNESDDLPNLNTAINSQVCEVNHRNDPLQKVIAKSKNASFEDNIQATVMCRTGRSHPSSDQTSVEQSIDKNVNLSLTGKTTELGKNKVQLSHQPKSHDTSLKCADRLIRRSPRTLMAKNYLSNSESSCGKVMKNDESSNVKCTPESHECIYSKAPRDTLKNKNMPIDEKLALYEFEVDENEPVIKKKKRRNMKRVQKKRGDGSYHAKISVKKLQNNCYKTRIQKQQDNEVRNVQIQESDDKICSVVEPSVEIHNKTISEVKGAVNVNNYQETSEENFSRDVQNTKHVHFDEMIDIREHSSIFPLPSSENKENPASTIPPVEKKLVTNSIAYSKPLGEIQLNQVCETPKSGNRRPVKVTERQLMNHDLECTSPVAHPLRRKTLFRKLKDSSLVSELDVSSQEPVETRGKLLDNVVEEELKECSFSCPNMSSNEETIDPIVEHSDTNHSRDIKINAGEVSSVPLLASHSTPAKFNSHLCISCNNENQTMFSPIVQSPNFSPLQSNNQTGNATNSSLTKGTNHQLLCRASGVGIHTYERKRVDKWNIDNCFGFDEGCDDMNLSSPLYKISASKLKETLPFGSTSVIANHSSHQPSRTSLKRKLISDDHEDNTAYKSSCLEGIKENKKNKVTSQNSTSVKSCRRSLILEKNKENDVNAQNSVLPSCSKLTPFSNPLKQSKLDVYADSQRTPNNEESKWHISSPVLFKDDCDKTPIHFKEPARRSYNRLHKRSMQFVGDEWIEVDHEDDEEREKSVTKRSHKHKKNKEDKEAKKWMMEFNNQCEEIEDFELCVE